MKNVLINVLVFVFLKRFILLGVVTPFCIVMTVILVFLSDWTGTQHLVSLYWNGHAWDALSVQFTWPRHSEVHIPPMGLAIEVRI